MNFAFKEHFKEFQTHFQHNCQKFLTDIFISLFEINSNDRIRLNSNCHTLSINISRSAFHFNTSFFKNFKPPKSFVELVEDFPSDDESRHHFFFSSHPQHSADDEMRRRNILMLITLPS